MLGLPPDATLAEARAAYRRLAELYHPDRLRGLREDVQLEGAERMREATEAMRAIRERYSRPLVAPGRRGTEGRTREEPASTTSRVRPPRSRPTHDAGTPVRAENEPKTVRTPPSDAATDGTARLYHVQLKSLDAPAFRVNWGGRHAAATLAALRHAHTIDGPIRQFEWGSYEWVLDGAATRHLLSHVLEGKEWQSEPAEVVNMSPELRQRFLPARVERDMPARVEHDDSIVELGHLLELLEEQRWYSVIAEVY